MSNPKRDDDVIVEVLIICMIAVFALGGIIGILVSL